jgi:cell wall-associated NlpC family hydrolase
MKPRSKIHWLALSLLIISAAAVAIWKYYPPSIQPAAQKQNPSADHLPPVTRAEALSMAERYVEHPWQAGPQNIYHGLDSAGIRVDTPDHAYQPMNAQGWWLVNVTNIGIPYKWGGFDLPDEFDAGLKSGHYAGDCGSAEKRRLLDDAVSGQAVGIDCSGFVSRCWKLPRSYSTRELPQLCQPITDLSQLQPADIFNRHNAHVRLFAGWADAAHTKVFVYEANERVRRTEHEIAQLQTDGFTAWRYRHITD